MASIITLLLVLLASVLAGVAIAYALLSAIVRLGGGRRALPLARSFGGVGVLACFGVVIWAWCAPASGGFGTLVFVVAFTLVAGAFGVGMLIATLRVKAPDDRNHP
jgi:hypothetical protein